MPELKAVKKLKSMIEGPERTESVKTLAEKLGIARATLLGIVAGHIEARRDVIERSKKIGLTNADWGL
jgi:hypothetical protein